MNRVGLSMTAHRWCLIARSHGEYWAAYADDRSGPSDRRITKNGLQLGLIRYWDPPLNQMFPRGTRALVRYDLRKLSKVFVPSTDRSGYLDVPSADLRRPPITRAELECARTILTQKGGRHPTEDQFFATTLAAVTEARERRQDFTPQGGRGLQSPGDSL